MWTIIISDNPWHLQLTLHILRVKPCCLLVWKKIANTYTEKWSSHAPAAYLAFFACTVQLQIKIWQRCLYPIPTRQWILFFRHDRMSTTVSASNRVASCFGRKLQTHTRRNGRVMHQKPILPFSLARCNSKLKSGNLAFTLFRLGKDTFIITVIVVLFIPYFRLLAFGILVTLIALFSFRFFPSCPSCLA